MGQKKDNSPLLGLILILFAGAIGVYLWMDSNSQAQNKKPTRITANVNDAQNRERLEKSINTNIQMTNTQMEIEKEQIKVEANFSIPRVGEFVVEKAHSDGTFSQLGDRSEMNAARDLRRRQRVSVSASDIIQAELSNQQVQKQADNSYRDEYARQFIENARRNGYEIKLNADYKVISVRPIRNGGQMRNGEMFR